MSFSLQQAIQKRAYIYAALSAIILVTFTVSYALSSIALVLFIPFFFLDTRLNIIKKIGFIKRDKVSICFALFFLAQCIGYFYSDDKEFALKRIWVMLPIVFLPAILFSESIADKSIKKALSLSKYLIVLIFLYYLIVHVFWDNNSLATFVYNTVSLKLGISQFYLTFIVLVPILVAAKAVFERKQILLNSVLLVLSLFILLLLGNKTVLFFMLSLIIIGLFLLVRQKKYKKAFVLTLIISLGVVMVSQTPMVKNRMDVFIKTMDFDLETILTKNRFTETKNTLEHRFLINYLSGKEIIKSFPFGVGTGDYLDVLFKQYQSVNFKAGISHKFNNHNQYFAEFLKTGILGGASFICLLILLILKIRKQQFYYPIFLMFFVIGCALESYLDRQHGMIIFAFLIPYFYKLDEQNLKSKNR